MKIHSTKFLQQRKFYLVLPLLILPFVTLAFWALGGGQQPPAILKDRNAGLKLDLPDANVDNAQQEWDKFALYERAKKDSLKAEEIRRNDPYYFVSTLKSSASIDTVIPDVRLNTNLSGNKKYSAIEEDAASINRRIDQLNTIINRPSSDDLPSDLSRNERVDRKAVPGISPDVERLEELMESMSDRTAENSEWQQVNGLLEKILDVQHPERITEKIRERSLLNRSHVLPVTSAAYESPVHIMQGPTAENPDSITSTTNQSQFQNAFYDLEGESAIQQKNVNTIDAVVHETQTVVAGSIIKMRLLAPVFIQGEWLDKDQFVFGVCAINGERLTVTIQSIRDEHALYPVSLSVYDLDGLEGIFIPGAISRDAAKQATSQSIQDVQLYAMNNSLEMQAAAAGVEAAKGLFSKKAKLIKVTVKAGYQVLLKDTNQRNDN